MSTRGVLDCNVVHGSVNGEQLYKIIQKTLLPHLMPYNGINPHSIVVMDNASIHHIEGVKEMINEVGALLLYLPPHLPDYNPIEELFSKLKYMTKHYENFKRWTLKVYCMLLCHTSLKKTANTGLLTAQHIHREHVHGSNITICDSRRASHIL